jgi:serine/threonine protein kinase
MTSEMNSDAFLEKRFREYLLKDIVGVGGMGTVYKAYHVRLRAARAIKVLKPSFSEDENFKSRFEREARILARLEHKNLIRIYEFFEEQEHLFLVMEYAAGESLADKIEYMSIVPVEKAVDWVAQACEGLSHAHSQGVVHRDLSPDNIIITQASEGSDHVKIIDFGIAKTYLEEMGVGTLISSDLTLPGVFVGKIKYCSPEQAMGKTIDHRSDQYSLTLILFEALTGFCAFESETPMESLTMRLHEPPPKLSEIRSGSGYPSELQKVIDRALERNPQDRYPDMEAYRSALISALKGDTPEAVEIDAGVLAGDNKFEDPISIGSVIPDKKDEESQEFSEQVPGLMNIFDDLETETVPISRPSNFDPVKPASRDLKEEDHPVYHARMARRRKRIILSLLFIFFTGVGIYGYTFKRDVVELFFTDMSDSVKDTVSRWMGKPVKSKSSAVNKSRRGSSPYTKPLNMKTATDSAVLSTPAHVGDGPFLASSEGVTPPEIIHRRNPEIPHGVVGVDFPIDVLVQVVVLKNGKVGKTEVVNSVNPILDKAALESLKTWTFKAGKKYHRRADIITLVKVHFER